MSFSVAVDIGGTFTDLVAVDLQAGELRTAKTPSVPSSFVDGVIAALDQVELDSLAEFRHGTTVGTNTIIERSGARTGLITTAGFRDVLLAGRANKPDLYDSDWDPPSSLVPREWILPVRERIDYSGRVVRELIDEDVRAAAAALAEAGIEAVAIGFLNAFMNGEHERRTRALIEQLLPGAYVCTSSEVLPEIREFERLSTTVANAYLGPKLSSYMDDLTDRLSGGGAAGKRLQGELLVSHSGGGLMTVSSARDLPARICQSGPAAGVMGALSVASRVGTRNAISLDMGGTSADIAAITDGDPAFRNEWHIEFNIPILFPAIDLVTIGAGGGTIAWIDETGTLQAGPESAGADPGPACYGRGGQRPTNTDANLVLGRLHPDDFLGGRLQLDREAAERAIAVHVARPLQMTAEEAASSILRLSNAAMLNAVRLMTTQRGFDPRIYSLIAFGGAGGLHAADLATDIGMRNVIVPRLPGLTSAQGILDLDVRHDIVEPTFQRASAIDGDRIRDVVLHLEESCRRLQAQDATIDRWQISYSADLRYFGQISGYLTLPLPEGEPADGIRELIGTFNDRHAREFGYELSSGISDVEVVNMRATLVGAVRKPARAEFRPQSAAAGSHTRPVYFPSARGYLETLCTQRDGLAVGGRLEGPAVISEWDSTTVVPPHASVVVQPTGDLLIEFAR